MEVGAVKQAFNNEVILLKKNLNQAKIQIIHKLTRKAKTLTEKKCPEAIKEKLKRKAESAIKEVLIIKKIKPKDIAKFTVTHKGKLNDFINKPNVDHDKACARLLLHKALTNKYQQIKDTFGNVSIKDLFMSRQERRQLKKEAREKQINKKKKRANSETDNVGGVWDVEVNDKTKEGGEREEGEIKSLDQGGDSSCNDGSEDEDQVETEEESIGKEENEENVQESDNDSAVDSEEENRSNKLTSKLKPMPSIQRKLMPEESDSDQDQVSHDSDEEGKPILSQDSTKGKITVNNTLKMNSDALQKVDASRNKNVEKRLKDNNKNKNLNEKLKKRKFNKDVHDLEEHKTQIVDPFFITSSGDNYMSLVEPRPPDEVKETHKQGNRKYRRAVMFGLAPKPRRNDFRSNNNNIQQNGFNKGRTNNINSNDNKSNNHNRSQRESKIEENPVAEKLHPSWEAKKRQSTIVPFKGKKIMFDDS